MKVLITGCAGFIGSHLTERLLREGNQVIGVDGFIDNYDHAFKERNMSTFRTHPNFTFFSTVLQTGLWKEWLADVEVIYHQAALPGVRTSWGKAFSTYLDHNVNITQQLLEACRQVPSIRKIVVASSSSVYGTMQAGLTDENAPLLPLSPYGVTKMAMEALCQVYVHAFHLPIVLLRYFTVYGPRQRPDMSFHRFIRQIMQGEPLSVYGDGRQSRNFTYITDAIEANLLAAASGQPGDVFNIGGNREVQLLEVIEWMGQILQSTPKLKFLPEQEGDSRRTCANITRANSQLGYQPQVPLEEGLRMQVIDLAKFYGFHSTNE